MSFGNTKTPNKPKEKPKYIVPTRKCNGATQYYLTPELEEIFRKKFPTTPNADMMRLFGISFSTMQRFKRSLGLEKNMKVIKRKQGQQIKQTCEENGYYESLRGKRPSEKCYEAYKKKVAEGYSPIKALKKKNPRRYARLMKKRSEQRKELIKKERFRIQCGMSKRTNLPDWMIDEYKYTKREISRRYYAVKLNYIVGSTDSKFAERYTIYYDSETKRGKKFESTCQAEGWKIMPLPE